MLKKKLSIFIAILFFATIFGSNESFADEINGDKINSVAEDAIEQTESLEIQDGDIQPFTSHWGDGWQGTLEAMGGNSLIHWSVLADPRVPFEFSGVLTISKDGVRVTSMAVSGKSHDGRTITGMENLPRMQGSGWYGEITGTALGTDGTLVFRIRADELTHFIQ